MVGVFEELQILRRELTDEQKGKLTNARRLNMLEPNCALNCIYGVVFDHSVSWKATGFKCSHNLNIITELEVYLSDGSLDIKDAADFITGVTDEEFIKTKL